MARALVAGSSAAVLVLEILAGRLLAPYVGVSLETFTGIIGVVLAGIAFGAWAGGAIADHRDATPLIGAALVISGGLTWLVLPILSALGPQFGDGTTRLTVFILGAVLVLAGAATHGYFTRKMPTGTAVVLVLASALMGVTSDRPCDHETIYFCANIVTDDENASGRSLYLDGLRHAYVDLEDPAVLDVRYIRLFSQIAETFPDGPLNTLHIGGGGFSFPRFLQHERPGSSELVLEIDDILVDLVEDELGLTQSDSLQVHVGDARLALGEIDDAQFDLVIGDAFSSRAVPWHLTTEEFLTEVDRVMTTDGIYAMNVIDGGSYDFARAEVATLMQVFPHVQVVIPPDGLQARGVANLVLIASQSPLPAFPIEAEDGTALSPATSIDGRVATDSETAQFWDGAESLRDDFAPVDQLQE